MIFQRFPMRKKSLHISFLFAVRMKNTRCVINHHRRADRNDTEQDERTAMDTYLPTYLSTYVVRLVKVGVHLDQ